MFRAGRTLLIVAALAALSAAGAAADSWSPPTEQDYYSPNGEYYVYVVPGGGTQHARGTLYRVGAPDHADELWARDLVNPTAPHEVLVADSGDYVVTFDEWGRVGYGPNVVVIYGPGGELVRNFALEDLLTEKEIAAVPQTVSSRWWSGEHYIDEAAGAVVLRVVAAPPEPDREVAFREIRIRLSDGEVLP
jgi:hypothetical protein